MKKIFNILAGVAVMASVVACDVEYDPIVIIPNPELNKTGVQAVNTISIYDEQETVINVARTAGLSKEMNMNVLVDEALIDEYNLQNGTSYELLPSEYYTIPEEVLLAKDSLDVDFTVVTKPAAMVSGLGREEASDYVLPLRLSCPKTGIDSKQDVITVMLRPMIEEPKVTVDVPAAAQTLEFVPVIPLSQTVELNAVANFNSLEVSKVKYEAMGQDEVDAYNTANGTNYKLLTDYYTINEDVFTAEDMVVKSTITFDCSRLGNTEDKFLLPIKMTSTAYGVVQNKCIFFAIEMSQLKVWVSSAVVENTTGELNVEVQMNTPMLDDQTLEFVIDNSLVAEYNTANGTSYITMDEANVTVGTATIPAGQQKGSVKVSIDLSAVPYDSDKVMIPLTLKEDALVEGSVLLADQKTTYVVTFNTIVGIYTFEDGWRSAWNNGGCFAKPMSNYGDSRYDIILAKDTPAGAGRNGQKYASKYSYNMYAYFDVDFTKEIDPDFANALEVDGLPAFAEKPGSKCYALTNVVERGLNEAGPDPTKRNYSYFDMNTGIVYFDFIIEGYWSPGGPGGKEMPAGCTIGGDWFCAKFMDRVDHE